jgi:hypothetical protein
VSADKDDWQFSPIEVDQLKQELDLSNLTRLPTKQVVTRTLQSFGTRKTIVERTTGQALTFSETSRFNLAEYNTSFH